MVTTIKIRRPRFIRKDWHKISSLGLRRKRKQKWRKPKGRHNKLREKKKSHGAWPSIGYRSPRAIRGAVQGAMPRLVHNASELGGISKNDAIIIAHVGMKNKISIVKKAVDSGIKILNINAEKFLEDAEKKKQISAKAQVKESKK